MAASDNVDDVDVQEWEAELEALLQGVEDCFSTEVGWHQAHAYVTGLLSGIERKNGWTLAEYAHDPAPQKMQRLLNLYSWNADKIRDIIRSYVIENLWEPDGVLVIDETGFLKKGKLSAGVQRQYSGTAGRIENCQVGVFLSFVTGTSRAFVDRRLYLPESWIDDPERCEKAGIPKGVEFATKPELALDMIKEFVAARPQLRWGYQRESDGIPITELPELDRHTIIPLTLNEIRHMFAMLCGVACPAAIARQWSNWRRRHQAVARHYHYRRRIAAAQSSAARAATTQMSLSLPY